MVGTVALSVALVLGTQLASSTLPEQARRPDAAGPAGQSDYVVAAVSEAGFDRGAADALRRLEGVAGVVPRIERRVLVEAGAGAHLATLGGIEEEEMARGRRLAAGRWPQAGAGEVAINQQWARTEHLRLDSTLHVHTPSGVQALTLSGVFPEGPDQGGRQLVVPLPEAQRLFGYGPRVTTLALSLAAPMPATALRDRLSAVLPDAFALRDLGAARTTERVLEVLPLLWFSVLVALVVAFFLLLNAFRMSQSEQRRELGLLRLAGATSGQVRTLVALQAWAVALLGGMLGIGLAVLVAVWLVPGTGDLQVGAGTLVSAGLALVLGFAVATLAALLPARQLTRRPPVAALRPSWPARERRARWAAVGPGIALALASMPLAVARPAPYAWTGAAVAVFLASLALLVPGGLRPLSAVARVPFALAWPVEAQLARQQLLCWPRRSAATLVAIALSVATMVGLSALALGVSAGSARWVTSLFVGDVLLLSPTVQDESLLEALRRDPGVTRASPVRYLTAAAAGRAMTLAAVDPTAYGAVGKMEFAEGLPEKAWAQLGRGPSLLLSARMARELGVHAGDHLEVAAQGTSVDFAVAGVVQHSLPGVGDGDAALIGVGTARAVFGAEGLHMVQLTRAPGQDRQTALIDQARGAGMEMTTVDALRRQAADQLERPMRPVTAMALVAILLGLLAAANSVLLSVEEGRREIALLRTVGMTHRQARRVMLAQGGMLTIMALMTGIGAGALLGWALVHAGASPGFRPVYVFPTQAALAAVVGTLAVALAAARWPALRVRGRNLPGALRAE